MNKKHLAAFILTGLFLFLSSNISIWSQKFISPPKDPAVFNPRTRINWAKIAVDSKGKVYIIWTDYSYNEYYNEKFLYMAIWNGVYWEDPYLIVIENNDKPFRGIDIEVDGFDRIHLLWQSEKSIFTKYFNGETWSTPVMLTDNSIIIEGKLSFVKNTRGDLCTSWSEGTQHIDYHVYYALLSCTQVVSSWDIRMIESACPKTSSHEAIEIDNEQNIYLVWRDTYKIYFIYQKNGTWELPREVFDYEYLMLPGAESTSYGNAVTDKLSIKINPDKQDVHLAWNLSEHNDNGCNFGEIYYCHYNLLTDSFSEVINVSNSTNHSYDLLMYFDYNDQLIVWWYELHWKGEIGWYGPGDTDSGFYKRIWEDNNLKEKTMDPLNCLYNGISDLYFDKMNNMYKVFNNYASLHYCFIPNEGDYYITKAILALGGYEDITLENSSYYTPHSQFAGWSNSHLHEWILHMPNYWDAEAGNTEEDHGGHAFFTCMNEEIKKTKSRLDISTLFVDLDILESYFAPGIKALHDNFAWKKVNNGFWTDLSYMNAYYHFEGTVDNIVDDNPDTSFCMVWEQIHEGLYGPQFKVQFQSSGRPLRKVRVHLHTGKSSVSDVDIKLRYYALTEAGSSGMWDEMIIRALQINKGDVLEFEINTDFNLVETVELELDARRDHDIGAINNPLGISELEFIEDLNSNSFKRPLIRFIAGLPTNTCSEIFHSLTSELRSEGILQEDWNFELSVVNCFIDSSKYNWNHTKLLIRDKQYVLTGGHNLKSEYLKKEPTYDIATHMEGEAAVAASKYFDILYKTAREAPDYILEDLIDALAIISQYGYPLIFCPGYPIKKQAICTWDDNGPESCWNNRFWDGDHLIESSLPDLPPPISNNEFLHCFSLSRGMHKDAGGNEYKDDSADWAIFRAFSVARKHIYLAQDMIQLPLLWLSDQLVKHIYDALLRGVEVKIICNECILYFEIIISKFMMQGENYMRSCRDIAGRLLYDQSARGMAHSKLTFAVYNDYKNHNKFFLIDDVAFYIGSQNLYVPSIIDEGNTDKLDAFATHEHGFLIDEEKYTLIIREQYWDKIWEKAKNNIKLEEFDPSNYIFTFGKTQEDSDVIVDVPQNSSNQTITNLTDGYYGSTEIIEDGKIKYTPNADYNGKDFFSVTFISLQESRLISEYRSLTNERADNAQTVLVEVDIQPVNDPPVARDDYVSMGVEESLQINLLENDSAGGYAEYEIPSLVNIGTPSHGYVEQKGNGIIEYRPNIDFFGEDSFSYIISDGEYESEAWVYIYQEPVCKQGDVNCDEEIDIIDALLVAQYYVGLNPSGFHTNLADVNCDAIIDIVDALRVAQYYVGLIIGFC